MPLDRYRAISNWAWTVQKILISECLTRCHNDVWFVARIRVQFHESHWCVRRNENEMFWGQTVHNSWLPFNLAINRNEIARILQWSKTTNFQLTDNQLGECMISIFLICKINSEQCVHEAQRNRRYFQCHATIPSELRFIWLWPVPQN